MDGAQLGLEIAKLIVTTLATSAAAYYAIKIAASQRNIARQQAMTASAQAKTSEAKVNLDLFELRYAVFEQVWGFLSEPINKGGEEVMHPEFTNLIPKARFLFGDEIGNYMRDASQNRSQLVLLQHKISKVNGYPAEEDVKQIAALQDWFFNEASACHEKFAPYLDFSMWRADPLERLLKGTKPRGWIKAQPPAA